MAEKESPTSPRKPITLDMLKSMSPDGRARLYARARQVRDSGGQQILDLIDELGLPLRSGGMTAADPVYLEMEEIIWSPAGRSTCLEATKRGEPALAGVEPMIRDRLGPRYHPHDQGTMNAGYIVGSLMKHLGYGPSRAGRMPEGSVRQNGNDMGSS